MRKNLLILGLLVTGTPLFAQSIENTKVVLELENEPLEVCFKMIERQTGLLFCYIPDHVDRYTSVSLPKKRDRTVREVLEHVLKGTDLLFEQMNTQIVVYKRRPQEAPPETISGEVSDLRGRVMSDVNVMVHGTVFGTTTDREGRFSLVARPTDSLVFSYVGFKKVVVPVNTRTTMRVVMESEFPILKEVEVNAGYWKVSPREQTGSIVRIDKREISQQPVSNSLVALGGRMPGVFVQQRSGVPGGAVHIQIRGLNSLRPDGNYPMYIIDGVPYPSTTISAKDVSRGILPEGNPLNYINPEDIESIDILKDADATAIYGSRGANGVVLITTRKGVEGRTRVDVNAYQGVGQVTRTMELLNTQQWLEMRKEAFKNDGATMNSFNAPDLLVWDTTRYTDWQKKLIGGTAQISNIQASASGGNKYTQFLLSGGYYRETTVFPGDFSFRKGSVHMNLQHKTFDDRLNISLSTNLSFTNNYLPAEDQTRKALELAPNAPPIYNEDGKFNWANGTWINPFALLRQEYTSNGITSINSFRSTYEVVKNLRAIVSLGYNRISLEELQTEPISSHDPDQNRNGRSHFGNSRVNTVIVEPQLEYIAEINDEGKLHVLIGATHQKTDTKIMAMRGTGYEDDRLLNSEWAASAIHMMSSTDVEYQYNALFGRINYSWKRKYFVNLTGRRDGSSRFGPTRRFANFGAIGAAWIFSMEPFWGNRFTFLDFGKLRLSYGITGNDQIGDYGYLDIYTATQYGYDGQKGMLPEQLVNPDYSWEKNRKIEAALDLGLFSNRVMFNASYYHNRSSDQLVGYTLSVVTGYPSIQANLEAVVENKGWEFGLNTANVSRKNFTWKSSFNLTLPKNKLVSFPDLKSSNYASQYEVGKPITIQKKIHYTGVDPQTGVYTFEDLNGDGIFSSEDYQAKKKTGYDLYGGFQNIIRYKEWEFDFFFQFVKQAGYNYYALIQNLPGTRFYNQPIWIMDRWMNPGDIVKVQSFSQSSGKAFIAHINSMASDILISNATFVRLKNFSLSFHLKSQWLEKMKCRQGRIYIQGQNLLTFTDYLGPDPENMAEGALPPLRVISAGIDLTF